MSDLRLIRGASNSRFGGIHWYEWKPKDEALVGPPARDLVLLHPMDEEGAFFSAIAPFLAAGRTVLAPDYPGRGRSDALRREPTARLYAEAMIDTLHARDTHGRADLLAIRSGCEVAAELSRSFPQDVHRLVLIDPSRPEVGPGPDHSVDALSMDVNHHALIIVTASGDLEYGRMVAGALETGSLLELPGVTVPESEEDAVKTSAACLEFLDG